VNVTTGKNLPCRMLLGVLLIFLSVSFTAITCNAAEDTLKQTRPMRGVTVDGAGKAMDENTVAAGLKEALHVAVDNTVTLRGAQGGFGARAGFRIVPAPDLCALVANSDSEQAHAQLLRLEERMNRVAEIASAAAAPLLHQAVSQLQIPYAIEVLRGDDAAATIYLHTHKFVQIEKEFSTLVRGKMAQAGLYHNVCALLRTLKHSTGVEDSMYNDIHTYITAEALDGIFATLRHEEHAIRTVPAARTTAQIKRVFSR
jgi:hypothetical protein